MIKCLLICLLIMYVQYAHAQNEDTCSEWFNAIDTLVFPDTPDSARLSLFRHDLDSLVDRLVLAGCIADSTSKLLICKKVQELGSSIAYFSSIGDLVTHRDFSVLQMEVVQFVNYLENFRHAVFLNRIVVGEVDSSYNLISEHKHSADSSFSLMHISDSLVYKNTDSLKYFSFKRDTNMLVVIEVNFLGDGVYSMGGFYVNDPSKRRPCPVVFGGRIFFPLDARNYSAVGVGAFTGIQFLQFVWQMGFAYLENRKQSQNYGWMTSLLFRPFKSCVLFGINYSPLTGTGVSVGLKIK